MGTIVAPTYASLNTAFHEIKLHGNLEVKQYFKENMFLNLSKHLKPILKINNLTKQDELRYYFVKLEELKIILESQK